MRTIRERTGWLLFTLFVVAGCGGGVSGIGTKGDGGPGDPGDDIVGDDTIGPSDDGGTPIDPRCVEGESIGTGLACPFSGLTCPLGTLSDCNGDRRTLECLCEGQTWSCDQVTRVECTPPPPPPSCPDPSSLYPGGPCAVLTDQQCVSTNVPSSRCGQELPPPAKGECTCTNGGWSCPVAVAPCPMTACPSPYDTYAGFYCNTPGLTCSGDPQDCGDQVYYDALQCQGNTWVSIASTTCEIYDDGGEPVDALISVDASGSDAGFGSD